jgi:hypothetical protein
MQHRALALAPLLLLLATPGATAEEEPSLLPLLRLPTIDGTQTIGTWELRGQKLLRIEFASW